MESQATKVGMAGENALELPDLAQHITLRSGVESDVGRGKLTRLLGDDDAGAVAAASGRHHLVVRNFYGAILAFGEVAVRHYDDHIVRPPVQNIQDMPEGVVSHPVVREFGSGPVFAVIKIRHHHRESQIAVRQEMLGVVDQLDEFLQNIGFFPFIAIQQIRLHIILETTESIRALSVEIFDEVRYHERLVKIAFLGPIAPAGFGIDHDASRAGFNYEVFQSVGKSFFQTVFSSPLGREKMSR